MYVQHSWVMVQVVCSHPPDALRAQALLQIRNRMPGSPGVEWMAAWRRVLQETCGPKCFQPHSQVQVQAATQQVLFNGISRACKLDGGDVGSVEGVYSAGWSLRVVI